MIRERLERLALAAPEKPALLAPGQRPLSRRGLADACSGFAGVLHEAGIGPESRVAIVLPGGAVMALASLAVMGSAAAMPCNPEATAEELAAFLDQARPDLLLTSRRHQGLAWQAGEAAGVPAIDLTWTGEDAAGVFACANAVTVRPRAAAAAGEADDLPALIIQTSGTSARPKMVPLSRRNLLAAIDGLIASLALTPDDLCLNMMPQFHIGGMWDTVAGSLLSGGAVACIGVFSATAFQRGIAEFAPTWTQAVPAMTAEILRADDGTALSCLRLLRSVSAPLPPALREGFEARFGVPIIEIYGMSETAGTITSNPLPPAERPVGSVGLPVHLAVRIVGEDGAELPVGATGEVEVAGASVITGYLEAPEANRESFRDGHLRTGDLGRFDADGHLYLTGRSKDQINRGGEKIAPSEVDNALIAHPFVADAACFAVPDKSLGEDIAAAVILEPGAPEGVEADILATLRTRLTYFKIPKRLLVFDALPRTKGGKLQRRLLPQMLAARLAEAPQAAPRAPYAAPTSAVGTLVADLWEEIIGEGPMGLGDNFFAMGGTSLKAAFFVSRLEQRFDGQIVYVSSVYEAPTVALYEAFLRRHYPEIVAMIEREELAPETGAESAVTPQMAERLRAAIALTLRGAAVAAERNPRAIFILSPPRSGSTLLRAMLAGHPGLFAPPELYLLSFDAMAERRDWFQGPHGSQLEGAVRALMEARQAGAEDCFAEIARAEAEGRSTQAFYRTLQEAIAPRLLVDKTPVYAVRPEILARAEALFEAPLYVHLTRHPYGMIASFEEAKLGQLWWPRLVGPHAPDEQRASPFSERQLGQLLWSLIHGNILAFLEGIPAERRMSLRYEDVVADPEAEMRRFCDFAGLDYAAAMLAPQDRAAARMTDGIHAASRMIGDPKFHRHGGISTASSERWRERFDHDFLDEATWALARRLGFEETVAEGRVEFAF